MVQTGKTKRTAQESKNLVAAPPALDAFRADILEVFLFYVRSMAVMTNETTAWTLTGAPPLTELKGELLSPDVDAADFGLHYNHVRTSQLAVVLEAIYQYAYFGRREATIDDAMELGTIYTWITALVIDAARGEVQDEWESFGGGHGGADRCLRALELANARAVLEGEDGFYWFVDSTGAGALTVRQMALLAGMEEMSIRAAANPKRANTLQTYSDQGNTRIAIDVAKAWLQSKGRYVDVTLVDSTAPVDLTRQRFTTVDAFRTMIDTQYERLLSDEKFAQRAPAHLQAAGLFWESGHVWQLGALDLVAPDFADEETLRALANVLDLPADLLVLRALEAIASQQLARVQRQLEEVLKSPLPSAADSNDGAQP